MADFGPHEYVVLSTGMYNHGYHRRGCVAVDAMNNPERPEIKLPRRTLDMSALANEHAKPEEALLLLSESTVAALDGLPGAARLEVRDMLFELGRAMQNSAFPTLRIDLDLELEPPQDWAASVSLQGNEVRSFTHSKPEVAYSFAVREGIIQATSMGIRARSAMMVEWSVALGRACESLDGIAYVLHNEEKRRDARDDMSVDATDLKLNPEGEADGG